MEDCEGITTSTGECLLVDGGLPIEDDPVFVDVNDDTPNIDDGEVLYCNSLKEDCDRLLNDFIENQREGTGIKLPFEPTIFNMLIIFGAVSAVVVMAVVLTKK